MFAIEVLTGVKIAMLFIVAVSALGATAFLARRARGVTTQALWLQLMGACGWSASLFAALAFHSIFSAQIAFVFPPILAAGLLLVSIAYPGEKWRPIYFLYLAPLVIMAIGGAVPDLYVTNIVINDGYLTGLRSVWNGIYSVVILIYMVAPSVLLIIRARAEARAQLAQRLRMLGVVSGVFYGISFTTNALLPALVHFPYLNATGPIWSVPVTFVAFWLLAQRYSIDKRSLKGYIMGRVAIFFVSLFVFVGMFGVLSISGIDPLSASVAATISTIFTLTAFGRVILYVIEKFAKGNTDDRVPELTELLTRASTVLMVEEIALAFIAQDEHAPSADIILTTDADESLSERVAEFISATQPGTGSFFLREHAEGEEWGPAVVELADTIGAALVIPLVHDRRVVGILALAEKRGGYTAQDCVHYARYGRIITAQLIRAALVVHAEREIYNLEAKLARS